MTRHLHLRVQTDLIPSGTSMDHRVTIGVRVSAAMWPTDGQGNVDHAQETDVDAYLLPWRWRTKPDAGAGTWNPHYAASWAVFLVKPNEANSDAMRIDSASIQPALKKTVLDGSAAADWDTALTWQVMAVLKDFEPEVAEEPETVKGTHPRRSVGAFVESLTALPAPVPAASKVWTALHVTLPEMDVAPLQIVAVPLFSVHDTQFDTVDPTKIIWLPPHASSEDKTGFFEASHEPSGSWLTTTARLRGARLDKKTDAMAAAEVSFAGRDAARVMDTSQQLIRLSGGDTYAEDWVGDLPARFGEAFDPGLAFLEAFETLAADETAAVAVRKYADTLANIVTRVSWAVVRDPTRTATRQAASAEFLLAHVLPSLATAVPGAYEQSLQLLGAVSAAVTSGGMTLPVDFKMISDARVAELTGRVVTDPMSQPSATRVRDEDFARFLADRWRSSADGPSTPLEPLGKQPFFEGTEHERSGAVLAAETRRPVHLLPIRSILARPEQKAGLRFRVEPDTGERLRLTLRPSDVRGDVPADPPSVDVEFTVQGGVRKVRLSVTGTASDWVAYEGAVVVTLTITASEIMASIPAPDGTNGSVKLNRTNSFRDARVAVVAEAVTGRFHDVSMRVAGPEGTRLLDQLDTLFAKFPARRLLTRAFAAAWLPATIAAAGRPDGVPPQASLRDRLVSAFTAQVTEAFKVFAEEALDEETTTPEGDLVTLKDQLRDRAIAVATRRALTGLVPLAGDAAVVPPAVRSAALGIPFDQLHPMSGEVDLWARYAGLAVLMTRAEEPNASAHELLTTNKWRSLNLAYLDATSPTAEAGWPKEIGLFDPVPLQVTESGAVRNAVMTYDNRSLIAAMAHDPVHQDPAATQRTTPRRIESYRLYDNAKRQAAAKVLALSFGKTFGFVLGLVSHGGGLPPVYRFEPDGDPTTLNGKNGHIELNTAYPEQLEDYVRVATYRRTVPVSAPRLDEQKERWPGIPAGVEPLAAELPIIPAPLALAAGEVVTLYRDRSGRTGVLSPPREAGIPALRIDLDHVNGLDAGAVLELRLAWRDESDGASMVKPEHERDKVVYALKLAAQAAEEPGVHVVAAADAQVRYGLRITIGPIGVKVEGRAAPPEFVEDDDAKFDPLATRPAEDCRLAYNTLNDTTVAQWDDVLKVARDMYVRVANPAAAVADVGVPVMSFGSGQDAQYAIDGPRAVPPPEAAHQKRTTAVLDGLLPGNQRPLQLTFRRPTVDFATYERWVNFTLGDNATARLDKLHRDQTTRRPTTDAEAQDSVIDDPAVSRLAAELVQIFPTRTRIGSLAPLGDPYVLDHASVHENDLYDNKAVGRALKVEVGASESFDGTTAKLVPGHVYELRVYGCIRNVDPASEIPSAERFDRVAYHGLRFAGFDAYRLGAPLTLTIEVATAEMPPGFDGRHSIDIRAQRPTQGLEDTAVVKFDAEWAGKSYVALRYVAAAALLCQRWGWRGRPLPDRPAFTAAGVMNDVAFRPLDLDVTSRDVQDVKDFDEIAFLGRRDDDIGVIDTTRVKLPHVLPGFHRQKSQSVTPLFRKHLGYRGGANYWHFAVRVTSRYAPMSRTPLTKFTHLDRAALAQPRRWHALVVSDRPTGRPLTRPMLDLVLPLTEPLMDGWHVPPLLAVFGETQFANDHIGDGIEAVVETARHPLPKELSINDLNARIVKAKAALATETDPKKIAALKLTITNAEETIEILKAAGPGTRKYWPQFSPDPAYSERRHHGDWIPLRLDGPLGYTFDVGTEAPRLGNSAFVVTPLDARVEPWSFVKLAFRRLDALETSKAESKEVGKTAHYVVEGPNHEGLAFDAPTTASDATLTFSIPTCTETPWVEVKRTVDDDGQTISAETDLGNAGQYRMASTAGDTVKLRIVVSQRPKPEGDQTYTPILDVSVRARVQRRREDGLVPADDGAWLTLFTIPLPAGCEFTPEAAVAVTCDGEAYVTPVRLSGFTPPVWCQVSQAASIFAVTETGSTTSPQAPVRALEPEVADVGGRPMLVGLNWSGETLASRPRESRHAPLNNLTATHPSKSQIAPKIAVVVTRYITDAFDRLRERPWAVYDFVPGKTAADRATLEQVWPLKDPDKPVPVADRLEMPTEGRLRIVAYERLSLDRTGKVAKPLGFPFMMLRTDDGAAEPPDAPGRIITVSNPVEFHTP